MLYSSVYLIMTCTLLPYTNLCTCFNVYRENGQLCVIIDLLVSRVVVDSGLENSFKDFLET